MEAIIEGVDEQLLMGLTAFYGGFHDASPAHILAMRSPRTARSTSATPRGIILPTGSC